jgi:hypothetical protein
MRPDNGIAGLELSQKKFNSLRGNVLVYARSVISQSSVAVVSKQGIARPSFYKVVNQE